VEVVFARPEAQQVVALELPAGSLVLDAVRASGLAAPEGAAYGRFGTVVEGAARLQDGDRIEILRPLAVDPKEARRLRSRRRR
jgi:putative ubiquitin-RnfH superfamily antitoxin RatB of RatAB toxin-antitoxin module